MLVDSVFHNCRCMDIVATCCCILQTHVKTAGRVQLLQQLIVNSYKFFFLHFEEDLTMGIFLTGKIQLTKIVTCVLGYGTCKNYD